MSRKTATLIILAFVVLLLGSLGIGYLQTSPQNVHVDIKPGSVTVTVYDKSHNTVTVLAKSGDVSLPKGEYTIVPSGDNINTDAIPFTVANTSVRVSVDPGYSRSYLDSLLSSEDIKTLTAVITAAYPSTIRSFTVNPGIFCGYGDWYVTTLTQQSPAPGELGDIYRTVLHKQDGAWKVAATPAIVLSAKDYPSIPKDVLNTANERRGY